MSITAIITASGRPEIVAEQLEAIRGQSVSPAAVLAWANDPTPEVAAALAHARLDRVVTCTSSVAVYGAFALAQLAATEHVAIFDERTIPESHWFPNCLKTMRV